MPNTFTEADFATAETKPFSEADFAPAKFTEADFATGDTLSAAPTTGEALLRAASKTARETVPKSWGEAALLPLNIATLPLRAARDMYQGVRFGGEPVPEQTQREQFAGADRAAREAEYWANADLGPLDAVRRARGSTELFDTLLPAMSKEDVASLPPGWRAPGAVVGAVGNVARELPKFFTTPAGVMTLAGGAALAPSALAGRAVAGGFTLDMASGLPAQMGQSRETLANPKSGLLEKAEAVLGPYMTALLVKQTAQHALGKGPLAPPARPAEPIHPDLDNLPPPPPPAPVVSAPGRVERPLPAPSDYPAQLEGQPYEKTVESPELRVERPLPEAPGYPAQLEGQPYEKAVESPELRVEGPFPEPTAEPTATASSLAGVPIGATEEGMWYRDPATGMKFLEADADPKTLTLSADVPNFKRDAGKTGEVAGKELTGAYTRLNTGRAMVWERLNGDREIITGRHRWQHALRNRAELPVQIVREADGFSKEQALVMDAEANIRDNQGDTTDYANYFRNTPEAYTQGEAGRRGLLRLASGSNGWAIGKNASPDAFALWAARKLTDAQAVAIANAAPGDAGAQTYGIRIALEGEKAAVITEAMRSRASDAAASNLPQAEQVDFFANTALDEQYKTEARKVAKARADLQDQITGRKALLRKFEQTTNTGSISAERAKVEAELAAATAELERWQRWREQPDLVARVKGTEWKPTSKSATAAETSSAAPSSASKASSSSAPSAEQIVAGLTDQAVFGTQITGEQSAAYTQWKHKVVVPVVRRMMELGWSPLDKLETSKQRDSQERSNTSSALANLKAAQIVDVAWDQKGEPHYALRGTALPDWLSATDSPPAALRTSGTAPYPPISLPQNINSAEVARQYGLPSDLYTNGLYLTQKFLQADARLSQAMQAKLSRPAVKAAGEARSAAWREIVDGLRKPPEPAKPAFTLAPAESVAQQTARLAQEQAGREAQAAKDKMAQEAAAPLTGTSGDLGQGDLLNAPQDLFAPPQPKPSGPDIIARLEESRDKFGPTGGTLGANPLPEVGKAIWRTGHNLAIDAIKAGRSAREAIEQAWAWMHEELTKAGVEFDPAALKQELYDALRVRQQAQRIFEDTATPEQVKRDLSDVFFTPTSLVALQAEARARVSAREAKDGSLDRLHNELAVKLQSGEAGPLEIALQAELADRYATQARTGDAVQQDRALDRLGDLLESGLAQSTADAVKLNTMKLLAKNPVASVRYLKRDFLGKVAKAWEAATAGHLDNLTETVRQLITDTRETARNDPRVQAEAGKAVVEAIAQQARTHGTELYETIKQQVLETLVRKGRITEAEAGAMRDVLAGKGGTLADVLGDKRAREVNGEYKGQAQVEQAAVRRRTRKAQTTPAADTDSAMDKAIRKAMQQARQTFGRLVSESGMAREQAGKDLASRLVAEAGLSGEAAQRFVDAFTRRWQAHLDAAQAKALDQLALKPKLDRAARGEVGHQLIKDALQGMLTDERFVDRIKTRFGVPNWTPEMGREALRRAVEIQATPEGLLRGFKTHSLYRWLKRQQGGTASEYVGEMWYSNLFAGLGSNTANVIGNIVLAPGYLAQDFLSNPRAFVDVLRSGALRVGAREGIRDAASTLYTGDVTGARLHKFDAAGAMDALREHESKVKRAIGTYFSLPFRLLAAEDLLAYRPWEQMEAARLAREEAKLAGKTPDQIRQHIADVLDQGPRSRSEAEAQAIAEGLSPSPATGTGLEKANAKNQYWRRVDEIIQQKRAALNPANALEAQKTALNRTLNGDFSKSPIGWAGSKIAEAKGQPWGAPLHLIMPVVRVMFNAADNAVDWTPGLNLARAAFWLKSGRTELRGSEITNPLDARRFMVALGGSHLVVAALAALSIGNEDKDKPAFRLEGSGPKDAAKRKQMPEGWKPNSVNIRGHYIPLAWFAQLGPALGAVANYRDAIRYNHLEERDAATRLFYAVGQMKNVYLDLSAMKGVGDFLSWSQFASDKALSSFVTSASRAASTVIVPNWTREIDRWFDPAKYTAQDIEHSVLLGMPFARRAGQLDLDWRGQPIKNSPESRFLSVEKPDAVGQDLLRMGVWASKGAAAELWRGVPMTPADQYEFTKLRQQRVYEFLADARRPESARHVYWQALEQAVAGKPVDIRKLPAHYARAEIIEAITNDIKADLPQRIVNKLTDAVGRQVKGEMKAGKLK